MGRAAVIGEFAELTMPSFSLSRRVFFDITLGGACTTNFLFPLSLPVCELPSAPQITPSPSTIPFSGPGGRQSTCHREAPPVAMISSYQKAARCEPSAYERRRLLVDAPRAPSPSSRGTPLSPLQASKAT